MIRSILACISLMLVLSPVLAQEEYSYEHYDIADGLAGSTVYCITQDRDGFIWMGTETGVSRFDGTHFRSFTTKDGLPDVEVLEMFGDSKGRVWMAPFRKSVCYYYKGKIYNQDNDSLLSRIHLHSNVEHFVEDAHGNIAIQEGTAIHMISRNDRYHKIESIHGMPISACHSMSSGADAAISWCR
ncbi:ligand-binding sensor domain-containing protein [Puia sp. P3]|uniref:ligand-binding sensor domain-containing protein n=1 Tax=Puia sp. P3 TaxID=3423952 RepID=UPI003D66BCC2